MVTTNERTNDNRLNLEQVRSWTVNRADFCNNCECCLLSGVTLSHDCFNRCHCVIGVRCHCPMSLSLSQISQRCHLISLIRCLKGRKSLGSLCSVVKTNGQTNKGTMCCIELFWTVYHFVKIGKIYSEKIWPRSQNNIFSNFGMFGLEWKFYEGLVFVWKVSLSAKCRNECTCIFRCASRNL